MSSQKRAKKSSTQKRTTNAARRKAAPSVAAANTGNVPVPKPTTDIITEKTYITTEPEIEIRKPATLAQALTEPPVAVVKPKSKIRKQVISRDRRSA